MADMSTYLMLDCVDTTLLGQHAGSAHALAGYTNGIYRTWPTLVSQYGFSGKVLLSISVFADGGASGAQCLDIEKLDATIAQAPAWFKATQAAGKAANDARWFPKLYLSTGDTAFLGDQLQQLVDTMTAAGIARNEYMIWSAHYTGVAHVCAPGTCGSRVAADATQYADMYQGMNIDASLCYGYFFAGPPTSKDNTMLGCSIIWAISGNAYLLHPSGRLHKIEDLEFIPYYVQAGATIAGSQNNMVVNAAEEAALIADFPAGSPAITIPPITVTPAKFPTLTVTPS